jgi:hypothetical protein
MYRSEKEEESDEREKKGQKKREKGKEKFHEHRLFNTNTPWYRWTAFPSKSNSTLRLKDSYNNLKNGRIYVEDSHRNQNHKPT